MNVFQIQATCLMKYAGIVSSSSAFFKAFIFYGTCSNPLHIFIAYSETSSTPTITTKPNIRAQTHFNQPCPEGSCWGRQEFGLSARRWRQGGCWRVWGEHHCTGLRSGPWRPASSLGKCTESRKGTQCNSYHTAFHLSNLNIPTATFMPTNTCQTHGPQDNIACD